MNGASRARAQGPARSGVDEWVVPPRIATSREPGKRSRTVRLPSKGVAPSRVWPRSRTLTSWPSTDTGVPGSAGQKRQGAENHVDGQVVIGACRYRRRELSISSRQSVGGDWSVHNVARKAA